MPPTVLTAPSSAPPPVRVFTDGTPPHVDAGDLWVFLGMPAGDYAVWFHERKRALGLTHSDIILEYDDDPKAIEEGRFEHRFSEVAAARICFAENAVRVLTSKSPASPLSTMAPMPMRQSSSTVQPWRQT